VPNGLKRGRIFGLPGHVQSDVLATLLPLGNYDLDESERSHFVAQDALLASAISDEVRILNLTVSSLMNGLQRLVAVISVTVETPCVGVSVSL